MRWRRNGWSALWRYRSRGRWRGGRPRVSNEVRHLIARMARENFLWGAPRIHGELLTLGFRVSQATVSRYLPARSRRPGQSWRTFLRNQASAFGQSSEQWSRGYARPYRQSCWVKLMQSVAAQIATACVGLRRGLGQQPPTLNLRRINLRIAQRDRGLTCRAASVSGGSRRALNNRSGAALPIRSPPHQSWAHDCRGREPTQEVRLVHSRARIHHAGSHTPRTHPHRREPSGRPFASPHARLRF
jgi:hypothetical protein